MNRLPGNRSRLVAPGSPAATGGSPHASPPARLAPAVAGVLALLLALAPSAGAATFRNVVRGTANGAPMDSTASTVRLHRPDAAAESVIAEIAPNALLAQSPANRVTLDLRPTIRTGDAGVLRIVIRIPAGFSNAAVAAVRVDGVARTAACPPAAPLDYCAASAGDSVTVDLGSAVTASLSRISIDLDVDAPAAAGSGTFGAEVSHASPPVVATAGDADGDLTDLNSLTIDVAGSQGLVMRLDKSASRREAAIGDVITYTLELRNTIDEDVVRVRIDDAIPPGFSYVKGSARLDGAPMAEPAGSRTLLFSVGVLPAWTDPNGNGVADPGEPGYRVLTYRLVIGSGATPGSHVNTAIAKDLCDQCAISNVATARVDVPLDPLFDLGTIVGKVFDDADRDGRQDPNEPGIAGAFVALDDGTHALTDAQGRYHFPAVLPGHRMVKMDGAALGPGTEVTFGPSRIVHVTPGLLARVNFGATRLVVVERIAPDPAVVIDLVSGARPAPVEVVGSVGSLSALVNGAPARFSSADVALAMEAVDDVIVAGRDGKVGPIRLRTNVDRPAQVSAWKATVLGAQGDSVAVLRTLTGTGAPPDTIVWDGVSDQGQPIATGRVYQMQLEVDYADGATATSPRRLFGVNRSFTIRLNLAGNAFLTGKDILSERARKALAEAAVTLRRAPNETVVIEGHTDNVGSDESNLDLSRRRAESALRFLVEDEKLPRERFVARWYGETRPIASNDTPDGREINRRIEIKGEVEGKDELRLTERFRAAARAVIEGREVPVSASGSFATRVSGDSTALSIVLTDDEGRTAATKVQLPALAITGASPIVMPANGRLGGGADDGDGTLVAGDGGARARADTLVTCKVEGRTDPGNVVEVDGRRVTVEADGAFSTSLELEPGRNIFGFVARNAEGFSRIVNLDLTLGASGPGVVRIDRAPQLSLNLPAPGQLITSPTLRLSGAADSGSVVRVNGRPIPLQADGTFTTPVRLPAGRSVLAVEVEDRQGRRGRIERAVEVARNRLFLLAFADGKVGQLETTGNLQNAGEIDASRHYADGRFAYYLKGVVAGKYLVTSALNTGAYEHGGMFHELDDDRTRALLKNLDPDKYYPVYGDSATLVHDVQTSGKFYLAVESDVMHALVGNYPMSLTDTELAAYQRTLYGARFAYRSLSKTRYGAPDLDVVVFGADVRQVHVRNELRATGGSLYYLSHRPIIEGSEEVTVVVRDKHTGLVLQRRRLIENQDYVVKYDEGRLLFHQPIASVHDGGSLYDADVLPGNPVAIEIDFETILESFEKTAGGARVRRQLGDHFAVGGTAITDEAQGGAYELKAVDAEIRAGRGTRIAAEAAETEGHDARVLASDDGGLTYAPAPAPAGVTGRAWRASAETDVAEWLGSASGWLKLSGYLKRLDSGFTAGARLLDRGLESMGGAATFRLGAMHALALRSHRDEREASLTSPGGESTIHSARYDFTHARFGASAELVDRRSRTTLADTSLHETFGIGQLWWKTWRERLTARIEHQLTIEGDDNDQTTASVEVQALSSLTVGVRGVHGDRGDAAQLEARWRTGGGEAYAAQRRTEDEAEARNTTVLGVRSPLGRATSVYSEYQWDAGAGADRRASVLGIRRDFEPVRGARLSLSGETAEVDRAGVSTQRDVVSAGAHWFSSRGSALSMRHELRRERGGVERLQWLTSTQADWKLNPDVSLLARYRLSRTRDEGTGAVEARFEERSVGLAWRPIATDRWDALARYTRLADRGPVNTLFADSTDRTSDVIAAEAAWRFVPWAEWVPKVAARFTTDETPGTGGYRSRTRLAIQRVNLEIVQPLELGLEYRLLDQREARDRKQGWLFELMWAPVRHMRVGAGYNFTDFSSDVASDDYSLRGWFVRAQGRY